MRRLSAFGAIAMGAALLAPLRMHAQSAATQGNLVDSAATAPEYFGLHIHRAVSGGRDQPASAWPDVGFGSWRLWDAHVAWADLEPSRGRWDFSRLDSYVQLAHDHGVSLLLTFGLTPGWASARPDEESRYGRGNQAPPRDTLDWQRYVDTVAKRYAGRIQAYEIWNEPNLKGFYSGTPTELATLARIAYRTVKGDDPAATVVSPSATGYPGGVQWLRTYLGAGGARYADVIGFHFYVTPADPEAMLPAIDAVRALLAEIAGRSFPIWNTESGWLMQNTDVRVEPSGPPGTFASRVLDSATSAAFVSRALVIGRCGGLHRFYWYSWDNRQMGLVDADGRTKKVAADAYATTRRWLVGAQILGCDEDHDGTWIARIRRADGTRAILAWSTTGERNLLLPSRGRARSTETLSGQRRAYTTAHPRAIRAGPSPTMAILR